jgi:hypothetical protein
MVRPVSQKLRFDDAAENDDEMDFAPDRDPTRGCGNRPGRRS